MMEDPRPELKYDSNAWARLLTMVEQDGDRTLLGILDGFRCLGLRLHRGREGYVLRPEYDPKTSGWASEARYMADRDRWLVPRQAELIHYLDRLTREATA